VTARTCRDQPDGYRPHVSSATSDPEWDRFLSVTPGGHHLQSSLWGQVKSMLGWRVVRVKVARDGRIHGGAQLLLRTVPGLGAIGYVARGPVLASADPVPREVVLRALESVSRQYRVRFVVVQPPAGHPATVQDLRMRGYREAGRLVEPHPRCTVVVDLSPDEDRLLAAMKSKTRYNIRLAQRRDVTVREGGQRDIAVFHRLLTLTGERQRFPVPSREYFGDLMRVMAPGGHARIFLAEVHGEPVSALLVVAFGDTVTYKRGGWSGGDGNRHPNELLHWTAMRWAKQQGYRHYDFEGIDTDRTAAGVPEATGAGGTRSVSSFKLGFGGAVVESPGPYELIMNPVLRRAYDGLFRHLLDSSPGRWAVGTLRTR
jgi:lipid II:glycine glycyltransferase (peptidoglycan interpeptide bridge formation enzyme)